MKLSNCVVGQVIEAKRDTRGHSNEHILKGLQVKINHVTTDDYYPLRVDHLDIDGGYAWVEPKDFRKVVQEATLEVQADDAVPDDVQVGTKVVCIRDFVSDVSSYDVFDEGTVYTVRVTGVDDDGDLRLEHPSLGSGHGYGKPKDFRLYKEPQEAVAPKQPVLTEECTAQNLQVGDTVVVGAEGAGYNLVLPEYAGLTCEVTHVHPDGSVDINHPDVRTWGNGYRSKLEHLTKVVPTQAFKVGDTVLVGSEGAGYGYVDPELADKVCTVLEVGVSSSESDLLRIAHPDVCPRGYTTRPQYIIKVVEEPVVEPEPVVQEKLPPTYIQAGDYVLSSGRDPELDMDTLYKVVDVQSRHIGIALHTSSSEAWQDCYCLVMADYSKVLREVQPDADTPTV